MSTWRPTGANGEQGPRTLRQSLDGVSRSMGGTETAALAAVFGRWEELVGPLVAGHAEPVSLRHGVLVVAVTEPAWATQLRFLQEDILEALNGAAGAKAPVAEQLEVRVRSPKRPERPR
jgi:predicted nucleic acid-binding Zn ribbon protein